MSALICANISEVLKGITLLNNITLYNNPVSVCKCTSKFREIR